MLQVPSFGVIHFLEVNQDRHVQVGGECIHAAQLRTVGGDVKLHLAEALCSTLHGLREHLFGIGLGHVVAVEPGEPAGCCGLERFHLVEHAPARQQIGLRDASAIEMREVGGRLRTKMEVQVENWRAPFARGVLAASVGTTAAATTVSRNSRRFMTRPPWPRGWHNLTRPWMVNFSQATIVNNRLQMASPAVRCGRQCGATDSGNGSRRQPLESPTATRTATLASIIGRGNEDSNQPPVANAGADQTVTANGSCRAIVALDGGASSDANGGIR